VNELEARLSPNPIFTGLLQEDPAESAARQLFGQLEAGHPIGHLIATPGVVHDPRRSAGDPFPYRASAGSVIGRSVLAARMLQDGIRDAQARADVAAVPVVVEGLISATPTGTINLRLRKPGADQ
jgi:hypothetical protein